MTAYLKKVSANCDYGELENELRIIDTKLDNLAFHLTPYEYDHSNRVAYLENKANDIKTKMEKFLAIIRNDIVEDLEDILELA